jgi:hypothetical protein
LFWSRRPDLDDGSDFSARSDEPIGSYEFEVVSGGVIEDAAHEVAKVRWRPARAGGNDRPAAMRRGTVALLVASISPSVVTFRGPFC